MANCNPIDVCNIDLSSAIAGFTEKQYYLTLFIFLYPRQNDPSFIEIYTPDVLSFITYVYYNILYKYIRYLLCIPLLYLNIDRLLFTNSTSFSQYFS